MEPTLRTEISDDDDNDGERRVELDLLAEVRETTHVREYATEEIGSWGLGVEKDDQGQFG
ncbi:hypothetical protein SESBI_48702 [Sesbania bispinosa]|nr:hypothetical protein SESBI_48702 [Sesbania bispinosa]